MLWRRTKEDGSCRHRFEPRYDERPNGAFVTAVGFFSSNEERELLILRTYVRDVCRYCGQTVERSNNGN
jgi:hypothetical protein